MLYRKHHGTHERKCSSLRYLDLFCLEPTFINGTKWMSCLWPDASEKTQSLPFTAMTGLCEFNDLVPLTRPIMSVRCDTCSKFQWANIYYQVCLSSRWWASQSLNSMSIEALTRQQSGHVTFSSRFNCIIIGCDSFGRIFGTRGAISTNIHSSLPVGNGVGSLEL